MPDDWRTYADAVQRVVSQPGLADRLRNGRRSEAAQAALGISPEMATAIKNLLMRVNPQQPAAEPTAQLLHDEPIDSARRFLDSSFVQLRRAYQLILVLSVVSFIVGIGLIVVATVRSFTDPESASSTAIIGGIGVAQVVVLFLRNPLGDIQRAVSDAQQARVAIMSYMLGVGLVGESVYGQRATAEDLERLDALTGATLERLERGRSAPPDHAGEPATPEAKPPATS